MPVSLNSSESQSLKTIRRFRVKISGKLKTTKEMVENALIGLHSAKGVTLKQVYNFISTENNLESLSSNRVALIKKYIKSLQEVEDIVNRTGKGLNGHFKLVDKVTFIKKIETNIKQSKESKNTTKRVKVAEAKASQINKINIKRKKLGETVKSLVSIKQNAPVPPGEATTRQANKNHSMFDTPMVASQLQSSTPLINSAFIPGAPEVRKKSANEKLSDIEMETPRSSLPTRKRKLRNHSESIY